MKVKQITQIGKHDVYDITVKDVNHYVLENGVVTHNTGLIYSANQAFIIGKSQEKDGTDLAGWNFTLNVEKSRFVREKSKMTFQVLYDGGIQKYSGLLDIALETGHVIKPSNGWYSRVNDDGEIEQQKFRAKDTSTDEFWSPLMKSAKFKEAVSKMFKLSNGSIVASESQFDIDDDSDVEMD